jgi:hypothetical protein
MLDIKPKQWCKVNGWTELRQLENGLWVAFPPGGFIETPLPNQIIANRSRGQFSFWQHTIDTVLMVLLMLLLGIIAIVISPCFILPLMKKYSFNKQISFLVSRDKLNRTKIQLARSESK